MRKLLLAGALALGVVAPISLRAQDIPAIPCGAFGLSLTGVYGTTYRTAAERFLQRQYDQLNVARAADGHTPLLVNDAVIEDVVNRCLSQSESPAEAVIQQEFAYQADTNKVLSHLGQ